MAIKLACNPNNVHNSITGLTTWAAETRFTHAQDLPTSPGQLAGSQWSYDATDCKAAWLPKCQHGKMAILESVKYDSFNSLFFLCIWKCFSSLLSIIPTCFSAMSVPLTHCFWYMFSNYCLTLLSPWKYVYIYFIKISFLSVCFWRSLVKFSFIGLKLADIYHATEF